MPDFIKLPTERVEQLRLLSKARDMTIADLIGEFVAEQIDKGTISPALPGIIVSRRGRDIEIDFGDFQKRFHVELGLAFATALEWLGKQRAPGMEEALADVAAAFSGAEHVGLSKQGTSIKISDGAKSRTLAPSIARELAGIVRTVATSPL